MTSTTASDLPDFPSQLALGRPEHLAPGLYIVATPIGNARDITLRALDVLSLATVIACEDTRVTRPLLERYGVETPLISYHEHNGDRMRPAILDRLDKGEVVALVSDAGTPLISDPGYKLVVDVAAAGHPVYPIPGPSSVMAALCLAGLPTDRFLFAGFLPNKSGARQRFLSELQPIQATLVLFEAARRLPDSLKDMQAVLGDRQVAVTRELTKKFEQAVRGPLPDLIDYYTENGAPKGEVVLVIEPPRAEDFEASPEDLDNRLKELLPTMKVKEAAAQIAKELNLHKRDVYQRALEIKDDL